MSDQRPERTGMPMEAWLAVVAAGLGPGAPSPTRDERALLLDLARVAARRCDRTAAPITAFVAGVALAGLGDEARVARLRALLAELDRV